MQWLSTGVNPRRSHHGPDAGVVGWKLHAVEASDAESFAGIGYRRSACGLMPRYGWQLDAFIEEKCSRCEAKLKKTAAPSPIAEPASPGRPG